MPKLTKTVVDQSKPLAARYIVWDAELKGFGLLVLPSGVRTFIANYRTAEGRMRRLTIGRFGVLTVDQARNMARQTLAVVKRGGDPVGEQQGARAAPTINELLDRYLADHVAVHNAAKTAASAKFIIDRHLRPRIGALKAAALTRVDVAKVHNLMRDTPRQANYTLAVLSKALSL